MKSKIGSRLLEEAKASQCLATDGTTFYLGTNGIHEALERANEAAGDREVRLGGGVATIRQ